MEVSDRTAGLRAGAGFALVAALCLWPILGNAHLPLVDLPNHMARHFVAANPGTALEAYYSYAFSAKGNSAADLLWLTVGRHVLDVYSFSQLVMAAYALNLLGAAMVFGRVVHGLDIEITSWSVRAATAATKATPVAELAEAGTAETTGTRDLYLAGTNQRHPAPVAQRSDFGTGTTLSGPAVITERETTIIVPQGFTAAMRADGCIELRRAS